ncbi:autotransporter domain-containing protein, partial [Helicobacter sp.]|uniref:autotransporter domain-containing protein n=1 Tax=Helicobacter sp. TaxID=218 RepID=UPI002A9111DC
TLFNNAENAVISNITNATIDLRGAAAGAAKLDVTNAGTIAVNTIKYDNKIKSFTNASTGVIETTFTSGSANAVINNFLNEGKITTSGASSIKVDTLFNNAENAVITGTDTSAITLVGTTVSATNSAKLDATNAGTINLSKIAYTDTVRSFVNEGTGSIIAQFSGGNAGAVFNSFTNKGSITASGAASDINVNQVFLNDKNAVINQLNTATIALNGATKSSDDVILTATNAGTIVVDKIVVNGTVASFANAATGVIQTTFSGGATNPVINNFTNEGKITASGASVITINKVFNNAENAVISTIAGTGNSNTITLQGVGINDDIVLTATNAGTITDASIVFKDISRSFANTAKGVIQNATFNGSDGLVQNFDNAGTILNSTLTVDATNFNNTGTIVEHDTTQGTIGLYGLTATDAVSFNNSGVIKNFGNAVEIAKGARNATFTNTGTIAFADNATKGLVEVGEEVTLNFNNADEIKFNANNSGAAISAIVSGGAVPTAKANIINTGKIALGTKGQHIDLTNFDSVNVQEWHLKDIKTANAFNGNNPSSGLDKIVVTGASVTSATDKTIKNLTFERGSIVINPIQQNAKFEVGQAYLLDRIVVDKFGNPVQEVYNINAQTGVVAAGIAYNADGTSGTNNGVYAQTLESLKEGATVKDPRLVTIDTISFTDPIFVMNPVDAYGALRDTATGNLTSNLGKVGEVDVTTGARYEADGIIDSFQVGVDTARGAGAAAVQSAVNNSITRNAFVGNVVNTAVNSALASLNNLNRVSYNDEEVDFSELEKYAAVSSDVTDQTYAKDSNVYVMPYYRSTSVDLAEGSLDADTYGIILGGNKNLGNAGVIGLFLGYENADGSSNTVDTEDDTFFGGINYYKTLGGTSTYDYFVKGMLRLANTSSDVTRKGQTYGTSSSDTFSYGLEANVGMNFYNGIHTITPEVGLSYDRVEVDGFKLNGVDYSDNNINLVVGKIGLNWLAQFTESVSTNVGFGIRYNFNDDFDTSLRIANGEVYSTNTDLGDFYYYLNLGVNVALTQNWELGVMYNGDFSSDASSHSGFVKLGYWW